MMKNKDIKQDSDLLVRSTLPLTEAIAKLAQAITQNGQAGKSVLRGRVGGNSVYLYRRNPLFGNIFKPVFVGNFRETEDVILLEGNFKMHWLGKMISAIWFSISIIFIFSTIVAQGLTNGGEFVIQILFSVLFLIGGVVVIKIGSLISRGDREFMINSIKSLL